MAAIESFDILVLGGGKGGKTLAIDQAKAGRRVAMVEAGMIGGSCINIACIPSKALVQSAEIAWHVAHASEYGVERTGWSVDMTRVAARTAAVVAERVATNRAAFEASGLELVMGWGRFVAPRVIEAMTENGPRRLTGERIYLDLGTEAEIPDIPGLAAADPMTHVEALKLEQRPEHLVVLGGGYVGMEFAQAYRRFGSRVTIVDRNPTLASREDADVIVAIGALFAADDIGFVGGVTVEGVEGRSGTEIRVRTSHETLVEGTHLLVAAGRRPRTRNVGLELTGVSLTPSGFIAVDEALSTTAPGIWALGEVAGTPMFTHAALDDYRVAKSRIDGGSRTTTDRLVPSCLYIDPEFARVGLSEKEAAAKGLRYRRAHLPMGAVARARTMTATHGFMKCLVAAEDDRILGFAMLGERAGEVMATVQTAMLGGLPYTLLRDAILAHPTLSEGFNQLFETLEPVG